MSRLDPELWALVQSLTPAPTDAAGITDYRAILNAGADAVATPPPPGVTVTEHAIPGAPGLAEVVVRVTRAAARAMPGPGILHIHGGGFIFGSARWGDAQNAADALALGVTIVAVDYRLAPEAAYPAAIEDCYAALAWMHGNAVALGIDRARIAVVGESAGGGLAAALALLARDRGAFALAFQLLLYPMLDDRTIDPVPGVGKHVWTADNNRLGWEALLAGAEPTPYAAAARAHDLAGLPPAVIAVGALDLFLAEDLDYARRLCHAGVPTEVHVYPGAPHAFNFAPDARVSRAFARDRAAALARALG